MADQENYTQIENNLLERLMGWHLTPNQWQVSICVIRKTNGFHLDINFIPNWKIVKETELCKEVVSRVLKELEAMKIIIRQGKNIGINKDVSQWQKLAKQSTKVSNIVNSEKLAELSTVEAKPKEKLAEQLTIEKLAIQSTLVSNPANSVDQTANKKLTKLLTTKRNKRNLSKETIQKKDNPKNPYGEFQNVFLTDDEYQKLIERFGEREALRKIENASRSIAQHGYKYQSHYATILTWDRKDTGRTFHPVPKPGRVTGRTEQPSDEEYLEGI